MKKNKTQNKKVAQKAKNVSKSKVVSSKVDRWVCPKTELREYPKRDGSGTETVVVWLSKEERKVLVDAHKAQVSAQKLANRLAKKEATKAKREQIKADKKAEKVRQEEERRMALRNEVVGLLKKTGVNLTNLGLKDEDGLVENFVLPESVESDVVESEKEELQTLLV